MGLTRAILQNVDSLEEHNNQLQSQLGNLKQLERRNSQLRAQLGDLEDQLNTVENAKHQLINSKRKLSVQLYDKNRLNLNLEKSILAKDTLNQAISKTNRQIVEDQDGLCQKIKELDQVVVDQHLEKWPNQSATARPQPRTRSRFGEHNPETAPLRARARKGD